MGGVCDLPLLALFFRQRLVIRNFFDEIANLCPKHRLKHFGRGFCIFNRVCSMAAWSTAKSEIPPIRARISATSIG